MNFKELDVVVLNRDLLEHRLRKGDLGTVVHAYEPDGLEGEFVSTSGEAEAIVALLSLDVRAVGDSDLVAVSRLDDSA